MQEFQIFAYYRDNLSVVVTSTIILQRLSVTAM